MRTAYVIKYKLFQMKVFLGQQMLLDKIFSVLCIFRYKILNNQFLAVYEIFEGLNSVTPKEMIVRRKQFFYQKNLNYILNYT